MKNDDYAKQLASRLDPLAQQHRNKAVVMNNSALEINDKGFSQQVVISPKLSPQMVEDLEMLSVFAEDKSPHGS